MKYFVIFKKLNHLNESKYDLLYLSCNIFIEIFVETVYFYMASAAAKKNLY